MKKILLLLVFALNVHFAWSQVYPALVPYFANGLWGYCDTSGKVRIAAKYDTVAHFDVTMAGGINNPSAKVIEKGIELRIDTLGKVIVPGGYKSVEEFVVQNNLFFVAMNFDNKKGVFFNGDIVVPFEYSNIKWKLKAPDADQLIFELKKGNKSEQKSFILPKKNQQAPAKLTKEGKKEAANYFHLGAVKDLKVQLNLDSIRFIENGLAYIEKDHKSGFLIHDQLKFFKKNYTIISANLLDKYTGGCQTSAGKLLVTIQVGDKYILMDENEKNYFNQEFTDTEGNDEYVVVKDYKQIGFFSKNMCYPPIATKYGKFIDPVRLQLGPNSKFLIFKVLRNGKEVLLGQNGAEYFKD